MAVIPSLPVSHVDFRASLKGQRVSIPNLYALFPEWKARIHVDYERARDEVYNPWLERFVPDPETCFKLKKADFGFFAAIMCADYSFEKLCTVAKYFAWYFIWDDIFDCGTLSYDLHGASIYRQKSVEYFRFALCREGTDPDLSGFPLHLQKALRCWDEVGDHIRETCSRDVCEVLLDMMIGYVSSVDSVDTICSDGRVPSVTEYSNRRDLTAGVYPVIATIPFICGIDFTKEELNNKDIRQLWKHTSYIVHITNDMFSMRKEVNDGQIENLIPVLMLNKGLDAHEAMRLGFELAKVEATEFRMTEKRLKEAQNLSSQLVDSFTVQCRNVANGLIHWSYTGQRYLQKCQLDGNQVIHFEL